MKILFFSDLHNESRQLEKLLAKQDSAQAQWIIQCGDLFDLYTPNQLLHAENIASLLNSHPAKKLGVCGNNDPAASLKLLDHLVATEFAHALIENFNITITHGHRGSALHFAQLSHQDSSINLCVDGHSHIAYLHVINDRTVHFNPGSLSYSRNAAPTSYAILEKENLLIKTLDDEQILFTHSFVK